MQCYKYTTNFTISGLECFMSLHKSRMLHPHLLSVTTTHLRNWLKTFLSSPTGSNLRGPGVWLSVWNNMDRWSLLSSFLQERRVLFCEEISAARHSMPGGLFLEVCTRHRTGWKSGMACSVSCYEEELRSLTCGQNPLHPQHPQQPTPWLQPVLVTMLCLLSWLLPTRGKATLPAPCHLDFARSGQEPCIHEACWLSHFQTQWAANNRWFCSSSLEYKSTAINIVCYRHPGQLQMEAETLIFHGAYCFFSPFPR